MEEEVPLNHATRYMELTNEHYILGKIVVEWSNIEFLLGKLLSRLMLTTDFLGRTYTDCMSAVKIQDSIREGVDIHKCRYSCQIIPEENLSKISDLNDVITKLRIARNKFAHFCWARTNDNEIFGTNFSGGIPNSKKHRKSSITYTLDELTEFYREEYDIVDQLSSLIDSMSCMEEDGIKSKLNIKSSDC